MTRIQLVVWGTKDRDEVKRREVWGCDGWVCDLEAMGVSSIFKTLRSVASLVRMLPTLDLRCEENTVRRKWTLVCGSWTPEDGRKRSVSRWTSKWLCVLLSLENLLWVNLRDYAVSQVNPNPNASGENVIKELRVVRLIGSPLKL